MKKNVFMLLLFSSLFSISAQQMPPIPIDPNVRIGKLENGLTYYIRRNALPEKRAEFFIAQKVGSMLEEDSQRGLAHFLEHMAFNGTKNFPGNKNGLGVISYLETIGVKFGVNLNAYTSSDETVYNISNVPITRDGIVDSCLLVLHDWANDLLLDGTEIDKERGVINEEWRTRQDANMRIYDQLLPVIYQKNRYAYRMPIGTMDVVLNFKHSELRDYYEKWYRPDLQGIIIVGDVDVNAIEAKIKALFADIPTPINPAERIYYPVEDNVEPIVAFAKDKETTNIRIDIYHKHNPTPVDKRGEMRYLIQDYATQMAENLLNMRFQELMNSATPPFMAGGVFDNNFILAKTKKAFTVVGISNETGIETAFEAIVRESERAKRFGFTESEYARVKADYLRELESKYNEREKEKNSNYTKSYVRNFIDNEPIPGIEQEYALMNQIVPNIPVAAINQLVAEYIKDENVVITIQGPDKEGLVYPTADRIKELFKKVKAENLVAYVDKVSTEPLLKTVPKAGKVVKEEKNGIFGTTVWTLSNGAKVVLKKTNFKEDQLLLSGSSFGGNSLFPNSEMVNILALNSVMELGGLGNFSATDLPKMLAGKKATVYTSVNTNTESVSGECSPKDAETMMQLLYLNFTAQRQDNDAFKSYQSRTKAALLNQESNPMVAFSDTLQAFLYGKHPRAMSLKSNMIDNISYEKVLNLYQDRFKDASDFTFYLVGNVDEATIKPLVEQYIASLPSIKRKESFKDLHFTPKKGQLSHVFARKMETPKATNLVFLSGEMKYTLQNEIQLSMLEQILDLIFTAEIREKEGGTYGVRVRKNITKYPQERFSLQFYFDTEEAKREKLMTIMNREVEKLAQEGPSDENLNKVKEFMLKKQKENLAENRYWLSAINEYYLSGQNSVEGYETIVSNTTKTNLQTLFKSMLKQNNKAQLSMIPVE